MLPRFFRDSIVVSNSIFSSKVVVSLASELKSLKAMLTRVFLVFFVIKNCKGEKCPTKDNQSLIGAFKVLAKHKFTRGSCFYTKDRPIIELGQMLDRSFNRSIKLQMAKLP